MNNAVNLDILRRAAELFGNDDGARAIFSDEALRSFIIETAVRISAIITDSDRERLKQRQASGIAAAKRRGVRFGRPAAELPANFDEVRDMYLQRKISGEKAAEMCGMQRSTFYKKYASRTKRKRRQ